MYVMISFTFDSFFIQRFRTSTLDVAPSFGGGKGRSNRRSSRSTIFQPWSAPKIRERRVAGAAASTAGASAAGGSPCRVRARPLDGGATTSEPSEISSGAVSDELILPLSGSVILYLIRNNVIGTFSTCLYQINRHISWVT